MTDNDDLIFAEELPETGPVSTDLWKLLIADDDEEVHRVTKMALADIHIAGRPLVFLDAYSGREAVLLMKQHPDTAMILMDVVMESDSAGLDAVNEIRNKLNNKMVRVVLRTGQPGQAPEREVVTRYDINDYKEKTELTVKKLFTLVYTGINLYHELVKLRDNRAHLERIVSASTTVFRRKLPERLARGALQVLSTILAIDQVAEPPGFGALLVAHLEGLDPTILSGIGRFEGLTGLALGAPGSANALKRINEIREPAVWVRSPTHFAANVASHKKTRLALYVETDQPFRAPEDHILDVFCRNVATAMDSAQVHQALDQTQRELIATLSEAIEWRSKETGNHVRRVGEYSQLLATLYGLNEEEAGTLLIAAPLHDAGKIAIPDAILNKPGRHNPEERTIMQTHAEIGGKMFLGLNLPLLKAAVIVAGQHHERWDGMGYPRKLQGEQIHIYGRITALADVFDALGSHRCYKKAWPLEEILQTLRDERGKHFEPALVDLFLNNLDKFLAIRDRLADPPPHDETQTPDTRRAA